MIRKRYAFLVFFLITAGFWACKPKKSATPPAGSEDVVGEDLLEDDPGIIPAPGEITPIDDAPYNPGPPAVGDGSPESVDDPADKTPESETVRDQTTTQVSSVDLNNLAGNKVYAINAGGQAEWLGDYKAGEYILVWGALGESFSLAKKTNSNSGADNRGIVQRGVDWALGRTYGGAPKVESKVVKKDDTEDIDNILGSSIDLRNGDLISKLQPDGVKDATSEKPPEFSEVYKEKQTAVQKARLKFSELKQTIVERYKNVTPEDKKRLKQMGLVAALSIGLTLVIALPAAMAGKSSSVEEAFELGQEATAACLESQNCVVIDGDVVELEKQATLEELACLYEPKVNEKGETIVEDGETIYSCDIENGAVVGSMNKTSGSFSKGDGGDIILYDNSDCVKNFGTEETCQKEPIRLSDMKSAGVQTIVGVVINPATGGLTKKWVSVRGEVLQPGT